MNLFGTIMQLFAGLGALLVGFKMLSENTSKLANSGLRSLFNKTSKNPLVGVLIGAGATAIIQSSGATTVLIVGFVNSGIMSLYQATAMIMGANIGTTITGQIAALKSLPIAEVAMAMTLVGMALDMFLKKDKIKTFGLLLAGLGLIFIGLELMSASMDAFKESPAIVNALQVINNPFLLLLIGIVTTTIVQSSSAITSILITMAASGLVIGGGGNAILYVILGTNIGSTTTALLSSFSANTNGKRTSLIHLLFNVAGSIIFFIILLCVPKFMDLTFAKWFTDAGTQVAMFHTFFNVICTLIFLPFIKVFVWVATKIYKDKEEVKRVSHLDARVLRSPSVALQAANRELEDACALAMQAVNGSLEGFLSSNTENSEQIRANIEQVNEMGKAITEYIVKVSAGELSYADEQKIGRLHYIVGDVVRVAELADNIVKHTEKSVAQSLVFSEEVKKDLAQMTQDLNSLYETSIKAYMKNDKSVLPVLNEIEDKVDNMRRKLVQGHIDRLGEGKCQPQSSGVFINLVGNMERIGDHLHAIGYSVNEEILNKI